MKRVTTQMFVKVTPEQRDKLRLKEMAEGLEDEELSENDNEEENNIPAGEPYETVNPPVKNEKKTKTTRNKEQRQKNLERKTLMKDMLKKQTVDINRIKSLKAEVLLEAKKLDELKQRRRKTAQKKKYETKRLGRLKYVEPEIDISMPEDISGNIRNIKPEASLLFTQFKRFQKRNILPMSVNVGKRKTAKLKKYLRSSHKEPGISHEMLRKQRLESKKLQ